MTPQPPYHSLNMQVFRRTRHNSKQWTHKKLFTKWTFRLVPGHHIQHWFSKGVSQHIRVARNFGWHIIAGKIKFINRLKAWWFKIHFTYTHVVGNKYRFRKILTLYTFLALSLRLVSSAANWICSVCRFLWGEGGGRRENHWRGVYLGYTNFLKI